MTMVISSDINKEMYDQKKGIITQAAFRPLVKLLEGPSEGQIKDFAKDRLKPFEECGTQLVPLVPTAGTPTGAAQKKDRAGALFGKAVA